MMKMTDNDSSDDALLKHWLATRSEAAFRTLVGRYAGLVHMAAMRTCGDASLAAEASQNTFIALAEKAGTLASRKSLAGWLHLTAVMQAKNLHRKQLRDTRKIEHFRQQMDPPTPEQAAIDWGRLSPLLDEALSTLPATDRDALLLRFYRSLSIQEVAVTLGIAHAAAQKRVNRATERLRRIFERKGVQTSGSLSAVMAAGFRTDAHAAQALVDTLTSKALAASAAGTTASLTTTTLILLMKKKATLAAAALLMLTAATTAVYLNERNNSAANSTNITTDQESRQAAGEAADSRSAASRKRPPLENPELVAKYGANRTALSRKISRELVDTIEEVIEWDKKNNKPDDYDRGMVQNVELSVRGQGVKLNLTETQIEASKKICVAYKATTDARDMAVIANLRKDPSALMERLLAADAIGRGTGEPAELAATQKRINDTTTGSDNVCILMGELGIVTADSGPLSDPAFVSAIRAVLDPDQVKDLDAGLEKSRNRIPKVPKALELDKMQLALKAEQKEKRAFMRMFDSFDDTNSESD